MGVVKLKLSDPELRDRVYLPRYREVIRRGAGLCCPGVDYVQVGRDYISLFSRGPLPEKWPELGRRLSSALGLGRDGGGLLDPVPPRYYGLALEYLVESTVLFRRGVRFELVDAEELELLLRGDRGLPQNLPGSPGDLGVLETLRQHGRDSGEYRAVKSRYLGTRRQYTLELYADDTLLDDIVIGDWYSMELNDEVPEPDAILLYEDDDGPDVPLFCAAYLEPLGDEDQEALKEHFQLEPVNDPQDGSQNTITGNTVFEQVLVHNVNQGLAVSLWSSSGLECLFDLGYSTTCGLAAQGLQPQFPQDYPDGYFDIPTDIQNFRGGRASLPVILSHWHDDHYRLIPRIPAASLRKLFVHAPEESAGVMAQNAQYAITQAHGTLRLYGPHTHTVPPGGFHFNQDLVMYKMQYTPAGATANHLHHKCIYATVELLSGSRVFLSGDCTYSQIPAWVRGAGYRALQVSHHGGDYHLDTPHGNPADIPVPDPQGAALYSFGQNNQHGHPDPNSVLEHRAAGWAAVNELATPGFGYLYVT